MGTRNKTRPTEMAPLNFLDSLTDPQQKADAQALLATIERLVGAPARMWGPSMVGSGRYKYTYESGRTGEMFLAGFAPRSRQLVIYLNGQIPAQAQIAGTLGPHKLGKACLYVRRLADIDLEVLDQLLEMSIADLRKRHEVIEP